MSYNILAISPGHNGSICLLIDGKIELYIEEERWTRIKYDANPLKSLQYVVENYKIDVLCLGGTGKHMYPEMTWTGKDPFSSFVQKYNPEVKIIGFFDHHHIGHAAGAFYNSGFDSAAAIIVDGSGSETTTPEGLRAYETESIYNFSYEGIDEVWKRFGCDSGTTFVSNDGKTVFNGGCNITKSYEAVTTYAGFSPIEAGKLMGLSSYGGPNDDIPELYDGEYSDRNIFVSRYPATGLINVFQKNKLFLKSNEENPQAHWIWQTNQPSIERYKTWPQDLKLIQDFAWKIQQETQEKVGDLIQKAIDLTGQKNVVISGGYALNCVANYNYKKRFPEIKLFVDPVAHDGGTSIGLAKLIWYEYCRQEGKQPEKNPLKTLYLGLNRNSEVDLDMCGDEFEVKTVTPNDVAKLIVDQNIVSIFNGSAEAGPRALGNRSILFDPRTKDGKDIVNKVKGREWFRPFAGTVLKEHMNEWFDMAGLEESPFMMYAVDVLPHKLEEIPCITHVDNTCRIQTVTEEQNEYYYKLIEEFYKLTGVPILFNTSFNLAGDPLVETFEDALNTLKRSELKYLYIPSKSVLLEKKND